MHCLGLGLCEAAVNLTLIFANVERDVPPSDLPFSRLGDKHSPSNSVRSSPQAQAHPGTLLPGEAPAEPSTVGMSTVTASDVRDSEDVDNDDTQPTSSMGIGVVEDSKSEGTDTDKACYGADSVRSRPSKTSNGSNPGSPDPTRPVGFSAQTAAVIAEWAKDVPILNEAEESGTALQELDFGDQRTRPKETHAATTAFQLGTPRHCSERKNAPSQHQAFQSIGVKPKRSSHGPDHAVVNYKQAHESSSAATRPKASRHDASSSISSLYIDLEAQHTPKHFFKAPKLVFTAVVVLTALIVGLCLHNTGQDVLVVYTAILVVLTAGLVIEKLL